MDEAGFARIFGGWKVDVGAVGFPAPTLVVARWRDCVVGYVDAVKLLERYEDTTLAVIEGAGHALMHEQPELLAVLLGRLARSLRLSSLRRSRPG